MKNKIIALVPAAGLGTRLGDPLPKQYLDLNGAPMIFHALSAIAAVPRVQKTLIILAPGDQHWLSFDWSQLHDRIETAYCGGASRGESVLNGLDYLAPTVDQDDWIMVHDAARPCIHHELIEQFLDELEGERIGGLLALPLSDTLKSADENLRVQRTMPRENLWRAQTPQMFRFGMLRQALKAMPEATDEAQAIEMLGHAPKLVTGDSKNLKVTYASDLQLARLLLRGGMRQ
jgi:2-C-methyl-D-erythritol 4-phosphate cytidylyltransferase